MRRYWIKQQQRGEPLRVSGAPAGCGSSASGELGLGAHPLRGPGRGRRSRSPETGRVGQAGRRTCRRGTQVRTRLPAPQLLAAQPARPRRGISEGPPSACAGPHPRRAVRHRRRGTGAGCGQRLPPARAQQPPPSRAAVRGRRGSVLGATLPEKPAGAASAPRSEF